MKNVMNLSGRISMLVVIFSWSLGYCGAVRNDKTFTVYNSDQDYYEITVKFGVGYTSGNKVNNIDVSVINNSNSYSLTVENGYVVNTNTLALVTSHSFNSTSVAAKKSMGKTHIIKNTTQNYTYKQIQVELVIDFGGTKKAFVFYPGTKDKYIGMTSPSQH